MTATLQQGQDELRGDQPAEIVHLRERGNSKVC